MSAPLDDDLLELYSKRLHELTREVEHDRPLERPDVTVEQRSPICGSTMTLDLAVDGETVTDIGYAVRACSLGQLGTAVLARQLPGKSFAEAERISEQVRQMLKQKADAPQGDWKDLELLLPAIDMRHRHGSALLPFEAVCEAIAKLRGGKTG
ncbi:iron-sulfur cluster assembly scaffold protein [Fodinicurvata sediminis]|uniref:iron-sulfur cluster assembly scaffold protein n=1 Tax=Fodinicurvata sediminis TaxID=1121832 RepID=UPI000411862D|nr:iron-sulfur cluster assembly scaffold protein [Fodinicurvata sediminis]